MDDIGLTSLEEVHNLGWQLDVKPLLRDKVLQYLLTRLLFWVLVVDHSKDTRQSWDNIWVHGDSDKDQNDRHYNLSLIRRCDVSISHSADSHYSPIACCDIPGGYRLIVDAQGTDPGDLMLLATEQSHYGETTAHYVEKEHHAQQWGNDLFSIRSDMQEAYEDLKVLVITEQFDHFEQGK